LTTNPFKEPQVKDLERIADALVGNLKDSIVINENGDGSKSLTSSLNETQIPSLVNAVVSYYYKTSVRYNNLENRVNKLGLPPKLKDDIYIKEGKMNSTIDKYGAITNLRISCIVVGKDEDGKSHEVSLEMLFKLYDINSTIVKKPSLEGKKVQVEKLYDKKYPEISPAYIGKYKSDIVINSDNKIIKVGERTIDITNIDENAITAKFKVEYLKGYEKQGKNKEITLTAKRNSDGQMLFEYSNDSGTKITNGQFWFNSQTAGLNLGWSGTISDEDNNMLGNLYYRVFE